MAVDLRVDGGKPLLALQELGNPHVALRSLRYDKYSASKYCKPSNECIRQRNEVRDVPCGSILHRRHP
jgi:hypothetical protein